MDTATASTPASSSKSSVLPVRHGHVNNSDKALFDAFFSVMTNLQKLQDDEPTPARPRYDEKSSKTKTTVTERDTKSVVVEYDEPVSDAQTADKNTDENLIKTIHALRASLDDPAALDRLRKMVDAAPDADKDTVMRDVIMQIHHMLAPGAQTGAAAFDQNDANQAVIATLKAITDQLKGSALPVQASVLADVQKTDTIADPALTAAALSPDENQSAVEPTQDLAALIARKDNAGATSVTESREQQSQPLAAESRPALAVSPQAQQGAGQTSTTPPSMLMNNQQKLSVANQNLLQEIGVTAGGKFNGVYESSKLSSSRLTPAKLPEVYEQVAIRMNKMAKAGEKSMTVNLNPNELGRVEVKLDFRDTKAVTAQITADNQQTLDLLRQDSRALERALSDAGLKLDQNSLNFSLRDGSAQQQERFSRNLGQGFGRDQHDSVMPVAADDVILAVASTAIASGRVDISI